jgi:hypothetical protein
MEADVTVALEFGEERLDFFRCRCAYLNSSVVQRSRPRCRAASFMWMARYRNGPVVHWDLCWHGPHFLRVPI